MSINQMSVIAEGMEVLVRAHTKWVAGGAAVLMLGLFHASWSSTAALARGAGAPSLAALTIRLGDLRPGYHVDARMRLGLADFSGFNGAKKAAVREHGALVGYDVDFLLGSSANQNAAGVSSTIFLFRQAAGAHWYFEQSLQCAQGARRFSIPGGGDESIGCAKVASVTVFRVGRYVASIDVNHTDHNAASAAALTRLDAARISAGG